MHLFHLSDAALRFSRNVSSATSKSNADEKDSARPFYSHAGTSAAAAVSNAAVNPVHNDRIPSNTRPDDV